MSPPSWGEDVRDDDKDGEEDVRGRQITNFDGMSEDEDVQDEYQDVNFREFWDKDQDGVENIRVRQISKIIGTSEDEDVDIMRRSGSNYNVDDLQQIR